MGRTKQKERRLINQAAKREARELERATGDNPTGAMGTTRNPEDETTAERNPTKKNDTSQNVFAVWKPSAAVRKKQKQIVEHVRGTAGHWKKTNQDLTMNECVSLPLGNDLLRRLVLKAKDYLLANGVLMRTKDEPWLVDKAAHVPTMLLPSPVPHDCFGHAQRIQTDINLLMHRVAHDHTFLKECLKSAIKQDDFTAHLWEIYEKVQEEGSKQPYDLAILRSDYMLDGGLRSADPVSSDIRVSLDRVNIKQIEINTIAASYGGLSTEMAFFHKYILDSMGLQDKSKHIPLNHASKGIAEGFVSAWTQYGEKSAVVLFVVQDAERNIYDQRRLEYAVHRLQHFCQIVRRTIAELGQSARLDENNRLFVDDIEVAVVYLRAFYTPNHLKSDSDWAVRLLLERSAAIKCPSVNYQLAGTKKVQQELARPGILERYVSEPQAVSEIRRSFAGLYSLDMGEEGDETVAMAIKSPEKFVLKPQREGGDNNIFGEDIKKKLEEIGSTEERTAYILMDRVHPVPVKNYTIMPGTSEDAKLVDVVSEMGIFGIFLGSTTGDIVLNQRRGYILRTKGLGVDEGGVSSGYAALDSPYLLGGTSWAIPTQAT